MIVVRMLLLLTIGFVPLCLGEEDRPAKQEPELAYLDNGIIIEFLADTKKSGSVVSAEDVSMATRRS